MAIIVVGGSGRGAGKTALICGLIRALPDCPWLAVKITSHAHDVAEPVFEETAAGQGTDTARYLAAGAKRALLVKAHEEAFPSLLSQVLQELPPESHLVFESNSVLRYLRPDLCLAVATRLKGGHKASYAMVERCMDASVALGGHDHVISGEKIHFHLASLERLSLPMIAWLRERMAARVRDGWSVVRRDPLP